MLDLKQIRTISANLKKSFLFKPYIYLYGGEPTLNPAFRKIVNYLDMNDYKLSIITNTANLKATLHVIRRTKNLINVTFSANEKNMFNLKKYLLPKGKNINLNIPIDILLRPRLDLEKYFMDLDKVGFNYISIEHARLAPHNKYKKYLKKITAINETLKMRSKTPIFFFPNIKIKDQKDYYLSRDFPQKYCRCLLPWVNCQVRPDGQVSPCDEVDVFFGNIFSRSFRQIWFSKPYNDFRKRSLKNSKPYPICQRCSHRIYY